SERQMTRSGEWGKPRPRSLSLSDVARMPDPADRALLAQLAAMAGASGQGHSYGYGYGQAPSRVELAPGGQRELITGLRAPGRCVLRRAPDVEPAPLVWDDGPPWVFWLEVTPAEGGAHNVGGSLRRGEERLALAAPLLLTAGGLVFTDASAATLDD